MSEKNNNDKQHIEIKYAKAIKEKQRKIRKRLKIIDEFKAFALRGNVIDLAVGVIIGGAFQKIVTSVVNDLVMPLVGAVSGNINFNDKSIRLGEATLNYGAFITSVIDFFIMAVIIFFFIKLLNKVGTIGKEPEKKPDPTEKDCPYCLGKIPIKAVKCKFCTSDLT